MRKKPTTSAKTRELQKFNAGQEKGPMMRQLYRRAVAQLRKQQKHQASTGEIPKSATDAQRLLHELQVHQVELELQNTELQEARDRMEVLLEKYTDLYDFAPVGYFSLNEQGRIQEVNLTGAALLGVVRSGLINQPLMRFVAPANHPDFSDFLKQVFAETGKQDCKVVLSNEDTGVFWARLVGNTAITGSDRLKCCRVVVSDISALKRAEEAQERLAAIVEFSDDAIIGKNLNGIITSWNKGARNIFGYDASEMVGSSILGLIPADRQEEENQILSKIRRGESVQHFETRRQTKDGRLIDVSITASPIKDVTGKIVGVSKTARDISVRKQMEAALHASQELLTNIINSTPSYIFATDRKHRYLFVNESYAHFLGRSAKKILGQTHHDFYPSAVADGFVKANDAIMVDAKLWQSDETVLGKAMMTVKFPLRDAQGAVTGICSVATDITKRKLSEDILRRNGDLFSALIKQAPVGVYVVDHQFRLQQMNLKGRPAFRSVRPLIGRDFDEILRILWSKRVAGKIAGHFRHTLRTGKPYFSPEFSERRHDTAEMEYYEWQLQRVTLPTGETGVVCFFNNITKRKQAEETQRRLAVMTASNQKLEQEILLRHEVEKGLKLSEDHQRELLAQSRAMQEQLRHLSHQILHAQEEERKRISRELHDVIAQTLTGINVRLATLKKEAGNTTGNFQRNINQTQLLVKQSVNVIHEFARQLRPAVLDDLGLIPALHSFVKHLFKRTRVRVHLKVFAGVEQLDSNKRTVIYRVAQESLTNVVRHANASRVEVNIQKLPHSISMKIMDNGKSFGVERALQANHGKRLGLLGMRERLEMVGGSFDIKSAPGKGTTVEAQIPLGKSSAPGGALMESIEIKP